MKATNVLHTALNELPGSIRELARECGVSHTLLIAARDGRRRLTADTRDAVVAALRQRADRARELADALEDADLNHPTGGDDEQQ